MIERLLPWVVVGFVIGFLGIGLFAPRVWEPSDEVDHLEALDLSQAEQTFLLLLARRHLEAVLSGESPIVVDASHVSERLNQHVACFVSLYKGEKLCGCMIDAFTPHEPLVQNVLRNAVLAATGDERFSPVEACELERVRIEISVLGPLQAASYDSADELLAKFSPGVDGVVLTTSTGQSAFLPWVWEQFPDPEQFLAQLCEKQGAEADCWRTTPLPKVDIFRVTDFSESQSLSHKQGFFGRLQQRLTQSV